MIFLKNLLFLLFLLLHPILIFILIAVFTDFDFPIGGLGFLIICVWYVFIFSGYEFNTFGSNENIKSEVNLIENENAIPDGFETWEEYYKEKYNNEN